MSHTPGPWEARHGHQTKLLRGIYADTGRAVVKFGGIASPTTEESQANARLIAAAPDLLAALERLLAEGAIWQKDEHIARAAIAKAKARFAQVFCSQCGREFGPGEHGFSHCDTHAGLRGKA